MKRSAALMGALVLALGIGSGVSAQTPQLSDAPFSTVTSKLEAAEDQAADRLIAIGGIPAPSGNEIARANAVVDLMREIGLVDVEVTDAPNVIGRIEGRSDRALIFVSTLDDLTTVAEHQASRGRPPNRNDRRIDGPGSNTSSTTVAMLMAAEALADSGFQPEYDLVFAGVAQEETGLIGMRRLYERFKNDAIAFVDVLGDGSTISYGALGIHWWRIEAKGPPGHTLRGGLPNVNVGIARAVDRIMAMPQPIEEGDRMTRANVAILQSGAVFNHKPAEGWFSLDLRSLDAPTIAAMEDRTKAILAEVSKETGIDFQMEPENIVPGGQIEGALQSDLVRWSQAIGEHLGLDPQMNDAGSANLNVAIADGTLAIGLGGERGGERGLPEEWADLDAMTRAAQHIALLAMTVGDAVPPPDTLSAE